VFMALWCGLKLGMVILLVLLIFFHKIDLAIHGLLHLYVNFRIDFPIFMNNVMEIWMGISLNIPIAFLLLLHFP
jgi:hypothetical protein